MSALTLGIYGIITAFVCMIIYLACYATVATQVAKGNEKGCFIVVPMLIAIIGANIGWWGGLLCLAIALLQHLQVL